MNSAGVQVEELTDRLSCPTNLARIRERLQKLHPLCVKLDD